MFIYMIWINMPYSLGVRPVYGQASNWSIGWPMHLLLLALLLERLYIWLDGQCTRNVSEKDVRNKEKNKYRDKDRDKLWILRLFLFKLGKISKLFHKINKIKTTPIITFINDFDLIIFIKLLPRKIITNYCFINIHTLRIFSLIN